MSIRLLLLFFSPIAILMLYNNAKRKIEILPSTSNFKLNITEVVSLTIFNFEQIKSTFLAF